jgi:hypothetical protein
MGVWVAGLLVAWSGWRIVGWLADEPHFADESAMIAQSYYYHLFATGQWHHSDWLQYAAFDHPPLPKYMFGLSLEVRGLPVPQSLDRWIEWMGYRRVNGRLERLPGGGDFRPPSDARVLYWARVPAALFGIGGVMAVYAIGVQIRGRLLGLLAAALLLANPLYVTHARRAMSDSFAECLVLGAVAVGLWGTRELWQPRCRWRRWLTFVASESTICGLAALAKLNGGVATVLVSVTLVLGWLSASLYWRRARGAAARPHPLNLLAGILAGLALGAGSFGVFVLLNPFLTARPAGAALGSPEIARIAGLGVVGRARYLVEFRRSWSEDALRNERFRDDWLPTVPSRLRATWREGYGRYSSLGGRAMSIGERGEPVVRFHAPRWAAPVWSALCAWGLFWAVRKGWADVRSGRAPDAWGLVVYAAAGFAVVALLIPLNWDRYFLPLQAASALLVPYGVLSWVAWIRDRLILRPEPRDRQPA